METFASVESLVNSGVQWLRLGAETLGALIICLGIIIALWQVIRALWVRGKPIEFISIRLTLARYLTLALELQLAADVLSTAIAPGWNEIGKLGAVAVIRTALNYFLSNEINCSGASPCVFLFDRWLSFCHIGCRLVEQTRFL